MGEWTLQHDVRQAFRMLRKRPGFAAAAITMLALGIGATTASFSVVRGVLIDPLPYLDPDRLVRIVHNIGGIEQPYFNDAIITTYADHSQAFAAVGAWIPDATGVTVTGDGEPEEVRALTASRGLLTTLGVQPQIGRWFSPEEDGHSAATTVLISYGYWQQKYGGDPDVLKRTIIINTRPHSIVGVMPAHFRFGGEFDVLLPLGIDRARLVPFFRLNGVARMSPGVRLADANADIARMLEIYFDTYRTNTKRAIRWIPTLVPLKQDIVGDVGPMLWVLMATIALVLLMACANVANLLLVRAESRRKELAIRTALGASSSRIARALLVESLVLAMLGGALGLVLADRGLRLLVVAEPANLPRLSELSLDGSTLFFCVMVSVSCGALFSLLPIAKMFGPRLISALSVGRHGMDLKPQRQQSQNLLVAIQLALALILLVAAGLMMRSFQALGDVETGFAEPDTLQTFDINIPPNVVPDLESVTRTQQAILYKVLAIQGVASAAFTTRVPMDANDRWSAALAVEDQPVDAGTTPPNRQVKVISPGAFQTFGTPLVAGRDFNWTDLYELREVAIVSENLARELWGSADAALGKRIRHFYGTAGPWREIVGVARDVYDDGVHQPAPATVYWPGRLDAKVFAGYHPRRVSVVVRTDRAGSDGLLRDLRDAVWSVNPNLPLARAATMSGYYERSMSRTSFTLTMLTLASVMALLLAVSGIYGVIAYAVTERRREIGIHMALGAQAHQIRGLFLRSGVMLCTAGSVLGLIGAGGLTQLMRSLLFGIEPLDPLTFAAMPCVLVAAVLAAAYLPARRALSVNPVEAMKAE